MRQRYSYFRIRNLRDQGVTYKEICEALGCCEETIRRALTDDIDAFKKDAKNRQKKRRERLRNGVKPC